jgi:hypothetical protein
MKDMQIDRLTFRMYISGIVEILYEGTIVARTRIEEITTAIDEFIATYGSLPQDYQTSWDSEEVPSP